jgi:hypothetical protein
MTTINRQRLHLLLHDDDSLNVWLTPGHDYELITWHPGHAYHYLWRLGYEYRAGDELRFTGPDGPVYFNVNDGELLDAREVPVVAAERRNCQVTDIGQFDHSTGPALGAEDSKEGWPMADSDNFERLEREQIQMRRDLADKLDKGGPRAQERAGELRELTDRMEKQASQPHRERPRGA